MIRHNIVNVLNEYNIGINIVKILNKRTMSTRSEENRTVCISERRIVFIGCRRICTLFCSEMKYAA